MFTLLQALLAVLEDQVLSKLSVLSFFDIDWEIAARAKQFNPATKKFQLCLTEKYIIMFKPEGATLNSRSEMFATCRHRKKLLLGFVK